MRFNYPKHEEAATTKNPATLYSKDIQAFAVTREYLQALRTTQVNKVKGIREANPDLIPYLTFIDSAFKVNPYYEV